MRHVWTGEMCGFFSFLWSVSGWVPRHRIHAPYRKVSQRKSNHSITVIKSTWCWKLKPKHTCHTKINIWESKIISNTSSGRMRSPKATRVSSKHFRQTLSHTQRWSCEIESTNKLASSNIHCLPNKKTIQKAKLSQGLHIGELDFGSQEDIWVRCFPTHWTCECPRCTKGPKAHADRMAPTRAASSRACSGAAKQALKTLWPKPLLVLPHQQDWLRFYCHSIFGGDGHRIKFARIRPHKKKNACKWSRNPPRQRIFETCLAWEFAPLRNLCQGAKVWDESQGLNHHFQLRSCQAFHCCW